MLQTRSCQRSRRESSAGRLASIAALLTLATLVPSAERGWLESASTRLEGERSMRDGWSTSSVDLDPRELWSRACWSDDGSSVFLLERCGVLLRLAVADLRVEATRDLGENCSAVARVGAQVVVRRLSGLVVLDPTTLTVRREVPLFPPSAGALAGVPSSEIAYVGCGKLILAVHTGLGEIVGVADPDRLWRAAVGDTQRNWGMSGSGLTLDPDGRWLIADDGGALVRFRVLGGDLAFAESGPMVADGYQGVFDQAAHPAVISPDGRYVAYRTTRDADGQPPMSSGFRIYRVDAVVAPIASVPTEARFLSFAPRTKSVLLFGRKEASRLGSDRRPTSTLALPDGERWVAVSRDGDVVLHVGSGGVTCVRWLGTP